MVIQISIAPILQQKKTFIQWKTKNVLAFLSFMLLIHLGTQQTKNVLAFLSFMLLIHLGTQQTKNEKKNTTLSEPFHNLIEKS